MKIAYKNLLYTASGMLLCLFLAFPASAQRGGTGPGGNSGSGGSRPSGGGGGGSSPSSTNNVSSPRPSGGGNGSANIRPAGGGSGNMGVARPSFSNPRPNVAPARGGYVNSPGANTRVNYGVIQQRPGYVNHQNLTVRGNYGNVPRTNVGVNRNYGYAPRTGVVAPGNTPRTGFATGGGSYRAAPAIGYGRGGYWGNHGYYYYSHGYYGSYYYPRIGFTCGYLPYGYYPFYWGDYQYFYSDGLFYQYDNSSYTVVEPPIGAEIATLPEKAESIVINGQQYYELNGVYYQPYTKDDGTVVYMIAGKDGELNTTSVQDDQQQPQGPKMGDIVNQLPQDCRKIKVDGQKLWVSPDGVYYQEQVDANKNKTYKVVGLPSDEPDQN